MINPYFLAISAENCQSQSLFTAEVFILLITVKVKSK